MKLLTLCMLVLLSFSAALAAPGVTPQGNQPAAPTTAASTDPGAIVRDVYQFALMIGGLLAFGAIVFGAIKYTLAAGNPSGQHEGREWITQALLGLLLLVGATVVLRTINPELLSLKLPGEEVLPGLKDATPDSQQVCPPPSQFVLQPDGTRKCTTPPARTGCDPSPAKQAPANGCTAAAPRCVISGGLDPQAGSLASAKTQCAP